MTDSKSKSGSASKESSADKQAPASKEAENQASAPEDVELGGSRLLGGPTSDDLNPAYAPPKDEGKDKDADKK